MNRNTRKDIPGRIAKPLPFFKPFIGSREIKAVSRVLRSGWLTTGPETQAFEKEFAEFLDHNSPAKSAPSSSQPYLCLAVNSATSGLHLALEAAGIGPGDLVAVPSMTFTASAEVIRYLGADPVFIDSLPESGNINPKLLGDAAEKLRNKKKKLKAVIVVHLAGRVCDMDAIRQAVDSDAVIIEDAAHAFPCRTPDGMAGTLGDIGVFSFYATKTITTGEGGMVVTRLPQLAERMRLMRLHGIDRTVWNRYAEDAGARSWEYDVVEAGYKYNMTDLAAALGRVQLSRADKLLQLRRSLVTMYNRELGTVPSLRVPSDSEAHAWHLYILGTSSPDHRDRIAGQLFEEGIGSSVHFIPLHRMTYWKNHYNLDDRDFPVATSMAEENISLPLWPGMKVRDLKRIAGIVREASHA